MKKIVLVALLAVAGCGNKKGGSDCDAAIAKGIENFSKNIKEHAPNPQIVERMMGMMDKLKGVLTERCKADNWAPEVVSCFTTVNDRKDMQACQGKLSPEQQSKLMGQITQVMMSTGGMGMRMPPGMPGHPEALSGTPGPGAPGAAPAPGTPPGSPDTSAAPGTAAPSATPPAPPAAAAPAGSAAPPPASGAPK